MGGGGGGGGGSTARAAAVRSETKVAHTWMCALRPSRSFVMVSCSTLTAFLCMTRCVRRSWVWSSLRFLRYLISRARFCVASIFLRAFASSFCGAGGQVPMSQ